MDAFITSGFLPVPAVNGGAVESLIQNLIDENEKENLRKFAIFSIYNNKAKKKAQLYKNTKFYFYKPCGIIKLLDLILYFILTFVLKKEKKTSYKFIVQRIFYINYVSRKLKKNKFKSVIVENNTTLFWALKLRKNYIKYSGKYYFHLHNDINNLYGCQSIIEGCKKIVTVSKYIAEIVKRKLNYDSSRIEVLKNCIDMNKFEQSYSSTDIMKLKENLKIDKKDKIIIFVGRTIKEKGIMETIKAFKKNKYNNWTLIVIGSSGFDIKIESDFEKKLFKETINNKKIIFTGFVPYSKIGIYYAMSDVAVLPSIWDEPAGLTMLEAVASSIPLITTDSGGIPEYVKEYGAIILKRDEQLVNNIFDNMNEILTKDKVIDKRLINKCNKEFGLDKYLHNFIEVFDKEKK